MRFLGSIDPLRLGGKKTGLPIRHSDWPSSGSAPGKAQKERKREREREQKSDNLNLSIGSPLSLFSCSLRGSPGFVAGVLSFELLIL